MKAGQPIEWDDAKSDACFTHRGFAYALRAFSDDGRVVTRDRRWDCGKDRYRLLGAMEGRVFVLIDTIRGSSIRIDGSQGQQEGDSSA